MGRSPERYTRDSTRRLALGMGPRCRSGSIGQGIGGRNESRRAWEPRKEAHSKKTQSFPGYQSAASVEWTPQDVSSETLVS